MTDHNTIEFKKKTPLRFRIAHQRKLGAAVLSCAALMGAGTSLAYLTDHDYTQNNFTVVRALDIELIEPTWDALPDTDKDGTPDVAEAVVPRQTIPKDPAVANTSDTAAYVFLKVQVPTYDVVLTDISGQLQPHALTELFTYTINTDEWVEMGTAAYDGSIHMTTHYYAHPAIMQVGAKTGSLFDQVTLVNLADGQLSDGTTAKTMKTSIDIDAYGIQSEGLKDYQTAWNAYITQNA